MKFSEILLSEYDEYGIPVFIYFAYHANSIACIRCVVTKAAYVENRFDDLDIESQKRAMEKMVFEIGFKNVISHWVEKDVIGEKRKIIVNMFDQVKIESFLIFSNREFCRIPTSITQIEPPGSPLVPNQWPSFRRPLP